MFSTPIRASTLHQDVWRVVRGFSWLYLGIGVAFLGGLIQFVLVWVCYVAWYASLGFMLYGSWTVAVEGVLAGGKSRKKDVTMAGAVNILLGLGLFLVPFLFRWPVTAALPEGGETFAGTSFAVLSGSMLLVLLGCFTVVFSSLGQSRAPWLAGRRRPLVVRSYRALVTEATPSAQSVRLCAACGAKLSGDGKLCPVCATPIAPH